MHAPIELVRRHDVVPTTAELQHHRGYGRHAAGRVVGRLRILQRNHLMAQAEYRGIKVARVDVQTMLCPEFPREQLVQRLRLHDGKH
jgi:hypothetical protein